MSKPICPRCNSTRVVGYAFSAGHDQCQACGLLAPVREFHSERRAVNVSRPYYVDETHMTTPEPARKLALSSKYGRMGKPKAGDRYWWQDE